MFQLIVAACSILHSPTCKAETLIVEPPERALPFEYMMGPQLALAKWQAENPDWKIVHWALTRPSRFARS